MSETIDSGAGDATARALMETTMSREAVNDILTTLPDVGGPANLKLDDSGDCEFRDRDGRRMAISHREPYAAVTLMAELLEATDAPPVLQTMLLEANATWQSTRGGAFGSTGPNGPIVYCRHVPMIGVDAAGFLAALLDFRAFASEWDTEIQFLLDAAAGRAENAAAGAEGTRQPAGWRV